jgi:hypothetical protein
MAHVYAAASAVITDNAGVVHTIRRGEKYEADHDLVRQRPELFEQPVEEATSNPGQKRAARRP